uniref:Sorting nexin 29 n=1 Tax=Equus asinus TaxID=9793 RepID=A0A9L0JA99_EQUAS
MSGSQNNDTKRQFLLERLLDAVKQCQIRFGGRKEIASDSDSRVTCLCAQFEAVLQHGLKRSRGLALTAAALKQAAGFASKTETGWELIAALTCDRPAPDNRLASFYAHRDSRPLPAVSIKHCARQGNLVTIVGGTFPSHVKHPVWGYITTLCTPLLRCPFFLREERPRAMVPHKALIFSCYSVSCEFNSFSSQTNPHLGRGNVLLPYSSSDLYFSALQMRKLFAMICFGWEP